MSNSILGGGSVYRMLFECSGDAIFVHDEGRMLAVNARACEHLGYGEAELLAMKPSDVDTPDESVNMPGRIDSLKSRKTMSFDTVHQRKDGSPVPVEVTAGLIEWGGRQAVMSICRDMTGKKKTENILLETALEWQSTFDSLKDSIFLLDSEHTILRCNKAASEMFRKKDGGIIGRHCWEVVHGNKEPIPACPIDRMMKSRKREMLEISSGDSWLEITVDPVFDKEGEICGTVHIISNITERKRFEDELLRSEERYRKLFESAKDGILLLDFDTGLIADTNPFLMDLTGYSHGELLDKHLWEVGFSKDARLSKDAFLQLQKQDYIRYEDLPLEAKNGKKVQVEFISNVYQIDGKKVIQCNIRDISDRKELESKKASLEVQNRQLQKTQSLDRMAGAISHHFNNKLNVVMGYLEMVIRDLPPGDSHAEKLERAMQSAQKAAEVSGNLLAYLGQILNKIDFLDLSEICTVLLPVLLAGMPKNVALETDLPSPGPYISADAIQIQQILTSLVINAWEAIGEETGTVRLNVKTVPAADIPESCRHPIGWQSREQHYACLEVTDSGCGLGEKDMENLFDPFFSTKFAGRGLGLSVVLGTVKSHKGAITVENRINGGSVFKVFFPLSNQIPIRQTFQVAKAPETVDGGTVLLVEDEEDLRKMTAIMLDSFGFTVLQARDGVEAVELFGQHKDEISCLFSDLTMPRMGGWETIAALRAIRHDLPVVLASGYDEASVMAGEHLELPDFFMSKPYAINKLGDTVCHAIARKAMAGKKTEWKF